MAAEAILKAESDNIEVEHWDMRFVKPLDTECLHAIFKKFSNIITVEDGVLAGGFGSAVLEFMSDHNYHANIKRLGVPDAFIDHGSTAELYKECGYDANSIYTAIKSMVKSMVFSRAG